MLQLFCGLWPDFRHCYAPLAFCVVLFSNKYLKKWYHLPAARFDRPGSTPGNGDSDCLIMRLIREQRATNVVLHHVIGGADECASGNLVCAMAEFLRTW